MIDDKSLKLLFMSTKKFESGKTVRGAFLLTDLATKPLEFRCTNPIRPSNLQEILYGEILEQHIVVELIGLPLVNSAQEKPALVLVKEPSFLGIRPRVDIPIIQIASEEAIPISKEAVGNSYELLHSTSGRFSPIILMAHSKYVADKERAKNILSDVFGSNDLMEPFSRISSALDQVHLQKLGEPNK